MKNLIIFLILLSAFLYSCGRFSNKENTASSDKNDRIVSVSKQLTEILFALGQGNKLVGVDLSSTYPEDAKKLITVGYHRMLSAEGIISLNPTVVYHNGGIGPDNVVPQLQKVGIPLKQFMETPNIDSTKSLIMQVAKEFGMEEKAKTLNEKLDADMKLVEQRRKQYSDTPKVLIIHFGRAMNQYFVMGNKGQQNEMIVWAGGKNAADTSGFRNLSPEVLVKAQPDVILATDFGFDSIGGEDKFVELPGLKLTPAYKNGKVYRIEEHDLVYFGPRTGENVMKIMDLIHK